MSDEVSVDAAALRQYLADRLGVDRSVELSPVPAGRSNETVVVTWGDRDLILRKPPAGESSEAAHNVLREYRIADALQATAVPTPETLLRCSDDDRFDDEFYLMERLDGHVVRESEPDAFGAPDARRRFGEELVDTLAAIHTVDVEAVGLDDLGHPDGFTDRQVDRWGKQLEWALDRTERRDHLADLQAVGDWLEANVPDSTPQTLVHGDYKIDNVIFATETPEIIGVLDWEMGTYGDPLTDLGWFLVHWHDAGDPDPILPNVTPSFLASEGYPTREELVERYERASGIDFENRRFYRALAVYKEAAACEVFYARYLQGTDSTFFEDLEETVPRVATRAKRIVDGEEHL